MEPIKSHVKRTRKVHQITVAVHYIFCNAKPMTIIILPVQRLVKLLWTTKPGVIKENTIALNSNTGQPHWNKNIIDLNSNTGQPHWN